MAPQFPELFACDDEATLKKTYKRLAVAHHPDKTGGSHEKFQALLHEFETATTVLRGREKEKNRRPRSQYWWAHEPPAPTRNQYYEPQTPPQKRTWEEVVKWEARFEAENQEHNRKVERRQKKHGVLFGEELHEYCQFLRERGCSSSDIQDYLLKQMQLKSTEHYYYYNYYY